MSHNKEMFSVETPDSLVSFRSKHLKYDDKCTQHHTYLHQQNKIHNISVLAVLRLIKRLQNNHCHYILAIAWIHFTSSGIVYFKVNLQNLFNSSVVADVLSIDYEPIKIVNWVFLKPNIVSLQWTLLHVFLVFSSLCLYPNSDYFFFLFQIATEVCSKCVFL